MTHRDIIKQFIEDYESGKPYDPFTVREAREALVEGHPTPDDLFESLKKRLGAMGVENTCLLRHIGGDVVVGEFRGRVWRVVLEEI